jgi:hypothetical protein
VPELYAGEVLTEEGIEHYLREKSAPPLALEEVGELPDGAVLVVVGVAEGDERRVPRPLVRVEAGSWLGILPTPVEFQHHLGLLDEFFICFVHWVSSY